jgi:hypothetical protein
MGIYCPRLFAPLGPKPGNESTNLRMPPEMVVVEVVVAITAVAEAPWALGLGSLMLTVGADV